MSTIINQSIINPHGDGYDYSGSDPDLVVTHGANVVGSRVGIYLNDAEQSHTLHNYGNIRGGQIGVEGEKILNYGKISSGKTAVLCLGTLYNYGDVASDGYEAVELSGGFLFNRGQIDGAVEGLFSSGSNDVHIVNNGTVSAIQSIGYTMNASSTFNLRNAGTIDGAMVVGGSDATARIFNTGTIDGSVDASGLGHLYFAGRGGSVTGTIYGTASADVITAGDDGETIEGFGGHDQITFGAGADTLDLTYLQPTWSGEADDPYLHGFGSSDTMVLDSRKFTSLRPGATPQFAFGSTAASTNDYLYLNPTNHWLYYDPDGSSGLPAHAIAHVDPSSLVTASSFKIV